MEDEISTSVNAANTAATNANAQGTRAKGYADNPPKIGDNGNWWIYDETTKAYKDRGIAAGAVDFECDFDGEDMEITYDDQLGSFDYDETTGDLLWTK